MLFTQCLLDLMGFPKDDTGKVTCVAGKLKFPFYVQKSKRKNVCQGYMATLRVDKEHLKKRKNQRNGCQQRNLLLEKSKSFQVHCHE